MYRNILLPRVKNLTVENFTTETGIKIRRKINPVFRRSLALGTSKKIHLEKYPDLEKDVPYIFVSTHSFTEDIISALHKIDRSAYVLIGTTDQVDHNPQMYAAWVNGMIYVKRGDPDSCAAALAKMQYVIEHGSSVLIFAEGGYDNKENELCQKLFHSPYYLAGDTGAEVVPLASFNPHNSKHIYLRAGDPMVPKYDNQKTDKENRNAFAYELKHELSDLQGQNFWSYYYDGEKLVRPFVKRNDLGVEPRFDFYRERLDVYENVKWSGPHIFDEELVEYYDPMNPTPEQVRASFANVRINDRNREIFMPILKQMADDQKYDIKTYMKTNFKQK